MCSNACGENQSVALDGDPMRFVTIGEDNFGTFFEPVEVEVWGDQVAVCTGVQGLTVYRAADACCVSLEQSIRFEAADVRFPRCQHLRRIGDRVVLTHRGDEIQPEPFLTVLDVQNVSDAKTLSTLVDLTVSFEGITSQDNLLYVALHEEGLAVYRLEDGGELTELSRTAQNISNAWKPLLDPVGAFLYLA